MRLTGIELDNWLAHRHFHTTFQPLSIICGPNESGKSSIADGISFAILQRLPRISMAADRDQLVSQGAKQGTVTIICDANGQSVRLTRDVRSAKLRTEARLPVPDNVVPEAADYIFDPPAFTLATTEERLRLMLKVGRVVMAPAHLKDLLMRRGFPLAAELSDEQSIEEWFDTCTDQAAQARGAWKAVTGTAYGEKKADTWSAEIRTDASSGALEQAEASARMARMKLLELTGKLGSQAGRAEGERERLNTLADEIPQRVATLERLQGELQGARNVEGQLSATLREMRGRPLVCVQCGTRHRLDGNALVEAPDDGRNLGPIASPADVANAKTMRARASQTVADLSRRVEDARRAAEAANEARTILLDWPAETPEMVKLRAEIDAKDQERQRCEGAAIAMREALSANERARQKTALAKEHHQAARDWMALRAQVASDGLPAELLKGALSTFNLLIADFCGILGWPVFIIGQDMQISRSGLHYELLSESAQWRVDAIIALALAEASGFKMVVLDRFDVLEPPARKAALTGFYKMIRKQRADSILLLGTLAKPPIVPPDVGVHWLGPVIAQEAAA